MRTFWQTFPIEFKGGLMTNISPLQQGLNFPGSASQLVNFEPSIEGGYKKILGYEKWAPHAVPGAGLIKGAILTDAASAIAVREGIYYTSTAKAAWVEKLNIGSTSGKKIRHKTFNFNGTKKVCMVDGIHRPVFWNSSSGIIDQDTLASSDVVGATRVTEFKNRLMFAKGSNIIYTAPFAERDYNPANGAGIINVGDRITGLVVFRDQMIVFCADQIRRLVGSSPSDFQLLDITKRTGTSCGDTIQEVGGDLLYLGPDGVRYLSATERNGDFGLARASEQIQNLVVKKFTGCAGEDYASIIIRGKAQYRIFRYESAASVESSGGFLGTRFLDQQPSGVSWAELNGIKVFTVDSEMYDSVEYSIFTNDASYVYSMESGFSFDGRDIPCIFTTPYMPVTDPQIRKTYYKHTLYMKSDNFFEISARLSLDYGQQGIIQPNSFPITQVGSIVSEYDESLYGTGLYSLSLQRVYENQVVGSSFTVALSYAETGQTGSFSLDTAVLQYRQNDRK